MKNKNRLLNIIIGDDSNISDLVNNWCNLDNANKPDTNSNDHISNWDVSEVTNMESLFEDKKLFNDNINDWDVSNVTNMKRMFFNTNEFNMDLNDWNVSNVTTMEKMFSSTSENKFNGNISNWNVGKVENMRELFYKCKDFNQDVSNWDVSKVTNMRRLFAWTSFDKNVSNWDISSVVDLLGQFANCPFNGDISNWKTSNVKNINFLFIGNTKFNQNINDWDLSNVIYMSYMFHGAKSFNKPLNNWNLSNCTNTRNMFYHAKSFNQDISNWNLAKVSDARNMFDNAISFNQDITNWNVKNIVNMNKMFYGATSFNQNIFKWETFSCTNFEDMFKGAETMKFFFNIPDTPEYSNFSNSLEISNPKYNWDFIKSNHVDLVVGKMSRFNNGTVVDDLKGAYLPNDDSYIDLDDFSIGTVFSLEIFLEFIDSKKHDSILHFSNGYPYYNSIIIKRAGYSNNIVISLDFRGDNQLYYIANVLELNTPIHLILIVDNGYFKFIVNGEIASSGDTNIEDIERTELRLGDSLWNSFNGYIKHFRFWNKSLSGLEISHYYKNRNVCKDSDACNYLENDLCLFNDCAGICGGLAKEDFGNCTITKKI